MKYILILGLVLVFWVGSSGDVGAVERGRVKIEDNVVVADNGYLLRGMHTWVQSFAYAKYQNISWWRDLRDNSHFNTVRVMGYLGSWPNGDETMDVNKLLSRLDVAVDRAEEAGMYVIIDNHSNCCGRYDYSRNLEFWSTVAPRYKDRLHVIYEIQNEPVGWRAEEYDASDVEFEVELYQRIRELAPNTHIIVWSFANNTSAMKAKVDEGVGIDYANASVGFHPYGKQGGGVDEGYDKTVTPLRNAYPTIATEFTFCCGGNPNAWIQWAEDDGVSWIFLEEYDSNGIEELNLIWPKDPGAVDGGGGSTASSTPVPKDEWDLIGDGGIDVLDYAWFVRGFVSEFGFDELFGFMSAI